MPSTSKKQHNFMAAIANNPAFAKKVGIKSSVGEHFLTADKGKKFKEGGAMKPVDMNKNPGIAKLPTAVRNKMGFMKKGGIPVFVITSPAMRSGIRPAMPRPMAPPQSWTTTVRSRRSRCSTRPQRSSMRRSRRLQSAPWSGRAERPIPMWSGATQRHVSRSPAIRWRQ